MLTVPYRAQVTNWSCALACAQMALEFHGHRAFDQAALFEELKKPVPGVKDQWQIYNNDLIAAVQSMGFSAESIFFDYTDPERMAAQLKAHVEDARFPLIATQRSSMRAYTGHSRLIVGVQEKDGDSGPFVFVHDPSKGVHYGAPPGGQNRKWKASDFAAMWKPRGSVTTGGTAVLIKPIKPTV